MSLIVGDLVDDFLFLEVPGSQFVIAMSSLVLAELIVKNMGFRNTAFEFIVNGRPSVLIQQGKSMEAGLRAERIHPVDLFAFLRINGFDEQTQEQIKTAIMEDDGELSVLRKEEAKFLQKKEKDLLRKRPE